MKPVSRPVTWRPSFAEIISLMIQPGARSPEGAAEIGTLAIEADAAMSREAFTQMFRRSGKTDQRMSECGRRASDLDLLVLQV